MMRSLLHSDRLLLVGNPGIVHVGAHFHRAAKELGLNVSFCDSDEAFAGSRLLAKVNWHLLGHRPARLSEFSHRVIEICREFQPCCLLSTGLAPIDADALTEIGELGVRRLNFLTDDPWNPAHQAAWFMRSLPLYDHVFSPRRANLQDLWRIGCREVSYLPFAYAPEIHYTESPETPQEREILASDVIFAGGADRDRIPYITALSEAGLNVGLYGGYWDRYRETRRFARGHADPPLLRKAVGAAKVALCLVRRANRDGHAMRSFEVPAIGACMLVEETEEHREIFGEAGKTVTFFQTMGEMVEKARWLLDHGAERARLAQEAHRIITASRNTYRDRLADILDLGGTPGPQTHQALAR